MFKLTHYINTYPKYTTKKTKTKTKTKQNKTKTKQKQKQKTKKRFKRLLRRVVFTWFSFHRCTPLGRASNAKVLT